jgi:hypothetical protein
VLDAHPVEDRMSARRYSDDEVRRILTLAAEVEAVAVEADARPWTLTEIERIGAEAGLAPQAVAAAAVALERQPAATPAHYFGLPVAVSRAVPLGRGLSDEDWERLVAELRDTFAARGRTQVSGARREWRVGNLRVTHEPAGTGAVLQLRTRKGDARGVLAMGMLLLLAALVSGIVLSATAVGDLATTRHLTSVWLLGVGGLLMMLLGALRLPAWARERARQFEALAAYARRIAAS